MFATTHSATIILTLLLMVILIATILATFRSVIKYLLHMDEDSQTIADLQTQLDYEQLRVEALDAELSKSLRQVNDLEAILVSTQHARDTERAALEKIQNELVALDEEVEDYRNQKVVPAHDFQILQQKYDDLKSDHAKLHADLANSTRVDDFVIEAEIAHIGSQHDDSPSAAASEDAQHLFEQRNSVS